MPPSHQTVSAKNTPSGTPVALYLLRLHAGAGPRPPPQTRVADVAAPVLHTLPYRSFAHAAPAAGHTQRPSEPRRPRDSLPFRAPRPQWPLLLGRLPCRFGYVSIPAACCLAHISTRS